MIDVFLLSTLVIMILYVLVIATITRGWDKNKAKVKKHQDSPTHFVSVVIAVRNEEDILPALLESLVNQQYSKEHYEVIFSDDFSDDNSVKTLEEYIQNKNLNNFYVLTSPPGTPAGKKQALRRGIEVAKGEIILNSDADCRMYSRWMVSMVEAFHRSNIQMVIGPVMIDASDRRFFSRLQALEFMSLLGATGGTANINHPIMCNGANLAYTKRIWDKLNAKLGGSKYASGDDMFLLHAVKHRREGDILFMARPEAIVYTQPAKNLSEFVSQRIRWAAKSAGYTDGFTLFTATVVGGVNLGVVISVIFALFNNTFVLPAAILFLIKIIADFMLLFKVAKFARQQQLMWLYPLLSLIYPFYVAGIILMSCMVRTSWKKRRI